MKKLLKDWIVYDFKLFSSYALSIEASQTMIGPDWYETIFVVNMCSSYCDHPLLNQEIDVMTLLPCNHPTHVRCYLQM